MARPLPRPDLMTAPYWAALRRQQLLVPECDACSRRHNPAEARCPHCGSTWQWRTSPGTGVVYSFSVVHRPAGPGFEVPYVLAVVEMDDGWMATTNIVGCDPEEVHCGMPVEVEFVRQDAEITLPFFRPAPRRQDG